MTQLLTKNLADEVRAELARHRVSAATVAVRLHRSESYVSRRLAGEVPLGVDDLAAIAELVAVSPVELLGRALQVTEPPAGVPAEGSQPVPPAQRRKRS